MGAPDDLPWVEGVRYGAPDQDSHGLWLPTHLSPRLPADLLYMAINRRIAQHPVLLWNEPEQIIPLDRPIRITPEALGWLERETDDAAAGNT
jgi:hypothetical protein